MSKPEIRIPPSKYTVPLIDPSDITTVFLRVPREERKLWDAAAQSTTRPRSNWVRHVCLEAAAKELGFTEEDLVYAKD